MNFYTIEELQSPRDGELVITSGGKPAALMLNLADGGFEETLNAVRQAKA